MIHFSFRLIQLANSILALSSLLSHVSFFKQSIIIQILIRSNSWPNINSRFVQGVINALRKGKVPRLTSELKPQFN